MNIFLDIINFFQAGMLMSAQQDGKEPEMFSAGTKNKIFSDS